MPIPKDKLKFPLWIHPETSKAVKDHYRQDDCRSQSEFIEKAIRFYVERLDAEDHASYLPAAFLSTMRSISQESDTKRDRMLFKIAVELAVLENVVAATNEVDPVTLSRLRSSCVQEVKRTHGTFSFEDAVEWQR